MNKNILIILGVGLLLVGFLVYSQKSSTVPQMTETTTTEQKMITVNLSEQNKSGEVGTATLVEQNGKVIVTVSMQYSPKDVPQPAHIHLGACPNVGAVVYPLTNLVNGKSVTTLETTLTQIESELPLGLNIHKSVPESKVYTACGDLKF